MPNHQDVTLAEKVAEALKHHFAGWKTKIERDFSNESFQEELRQLSSDPVYDKFGFAIPEYVLIRLMGRMSISIGRRLGEIYDKIPRFATAARLGLTDEEISPIFEGLELDVCIPRRRLSKENDLHTFEVLTKFFPNFNNPVGAGIEIRYNFNPNDSSRLRKDVHMAELLIEKGLFPIYLIFSEISPRHEAIARLKRAGWNFLVGQTALQFMNELIGMNISEIMDQPTVKAEVRKQVDALMRAMLESPAFIQGARIK